MTADKNPTVQTREYGRWDSPLSAEKIVQGSRQISFPRPSGDGIFFLSSLSGENNAQALMYLSRKGKLTRVSPPGVNIRSRVHEYGGLPFAFDGENVYYCNFADQQVLKQPFDQDSHVAGPCTGLTPLDENNPATLRYGDFRVDPLHRCLLCVREDHRQAQGSEPVNALVAIPVDQGGEGQVLFSDSDFVASPCLSPDGTLLAFQTWSHPDMPWDETQIRVAGFDGLSLTGLRLIKQETPGSLVQPQFNARGDLYFIADWSNWWNLYRVSARALQADCRAEPLLPVAAEFCPPQWQIGQHHYDFFDDRHLLVSVNRECFWELALLDQKNGEMTPLQSGLGLLENVFCQAGGVFFVAATATADPALQRINLQLSGPVSGPEVLYKSRTLPLLEAEGISAPEHFSCTGTGGESAYGIFYPPCNPAYRAPADTLPPLLVNVHGGPTSSARASFNPAVQFWTSRGFAVLDVNHRGSSGYGRSFRHRLYGNWGEMDVEDVLAAVQHLLTTERVAAEKVAIRGSSAGGYAVLAALVQSDLFSAGTCCYGISDLALLAAQTHKFESRYVEQLIGPWPEAAALYRQRSPLYHIDKIQAPVLLMQGMQDKVVPANQAQGIYERLREANPLTRLICFEQEGHGFRQPENQITALKEELAFYRQVLL